MTANGRAERPRRAPAEHRPREQGTSANHLRLRRTIKAAKIIMKIAMIVAVRMFPSKTSVAPKQSAHHGPLRRLLNRRRTRRSSWNGHRVPTFTSLVRLETPDLIVTSDLRQLKCPATKATSSALAFPSTGGAFNWAYQIPSSRRVKDELRELGLTFTSRITADLSRRSNGEIEGPEDPPTIVRRHHHQFPLGSET